MTNIEKAEVELQHWGFFPHPKEKTDELLVLASLP